MKKIILVLSIAVILSGCSNTENSTENTTKVTKNPIEVIDKLPEKEVKILSENKDILLEQSTSIVKNKMQINGLSVHETLNITIKDDAGNLLNGSDTTISTTEKENSWRQFVKYLYLDKVPETDAGILTIYSGPDNYVTLPITFEPYMGKGFVIEYPSREMEQTGFIRIMGKAFLEKNIHFTIESMTGEVIKTGEITLTNNWPDLGVFAIDIPLDIPSQDLYLKIEGEIIKIKFVKI